MKDFIDLGKKIYNVNNPRELRRLVVFVARSWYYGREMQELFDFFGSDETLRKLAEIYPFVYEQPQRAFFYNKSTTRERIALVKNHFAFIAKHFRADALLKVYDCQTLPLWETEIDGEKMILSLYFEPGQRKEGLLSLMLNLEDKHLYQIIFWLGKGLDGTPSMYIGALQGPNMEGAKEIVKKVTKACHTLRTKNLILLAAQALSRALNLSHIYAVTNYGYYANNHVRLDRKLKTDFSEFWAEVGGSATSDNRFFELPLSEERKTMEEVPTRKRAVYRRRFAFMDEFEEAVAQSLKDILRE